MIGVIGLILSIRIRSSFSKYAFYFFLFSLLSEVYMQLYVYLMRNGLWFETANTSRLIKLSVLPSTILSYASVATIFVALYKIK